MSEFKHLVVWLSLYKIAGLGVGLLFAYFGYRLFSLGLYHKAGELKLAWGERNLTLKQAAPGTFFALFGTGVICVTLLRGVNLEQVVRPPEPATLVSLDMPVSSFAGSSVPIGIGKTNCPAKSTHRIRAYQKGPARSAANNETRDLNHALKSENRALQLEDPFVNDLRYLMAEGPVTASKNEAPSLRAIFQKIHDGRALDAFDLLTLRSHSETIGRTELGPIVDKATKKVPLTQEDRLTLQRWLGRRNAVIDIHGVGKVWEVDRLQYLARDDFDFQIRLGQGDLRKEQSSLVIQ